MINRIIIHETDLTSATAEVSGINTVYIPGLKNYGSSPTEADDISNQMLFFSSKYDFINTIGSTPFSFSDSDASLQFGNSAWNSKWSTKAYNSASDTVIEGTYDIAYYYALYCLNAGIPIYYEVMNRWDGKDYVAVSDDDKFDEVSSPSGNPNTKGYYVKGTDGTYSLTTDTSVVSGTTYYELHTTTSSDNWYTKSGSTYTAVASGTKITKSTTYYTMSDSYTLRNFYNDIASRYANDDETLSSLGDYEIKYFTTGGYPVLEYDSNGIVNNMVKVAAGRSDSVALIDHTNYPGRVLKASSDDSVYAVAQNLALGDNGTYAAIFTPWYSHSNTSGLDDAPEFMPASMAYIEALGAQIDDYSAWVAVAGVSRGLVPNMGNGLHTTDVLTNNIADSYQSFTAQGTGNGAYSINPITYIRDYGYCIWGNRTLCQIGNYLKASNFLNLRSAISDIKKTIYSASQGLLFEQNTDILWISFKGLVEPLLAEMVAKNVISDYKIVKHSVDPDTGLEVPTYKIMATIRIYPINSIEQFDLTVSVENSEVTVESEE